MNPRTLLVAGLVAGLLAGLASFVVAYQVGEPHVEAAIALEETGAAQAVDDGHAHGHAAHDHAAAAVSRDSQRTWGLATGTLAVGLALGGILALVSAAAIGRLGRLTPVQTTAVVSLAGFVSFALVPFLKYPATPPAIGSGDTIGARTGSYFLFVVISVVVAVAATVLATGVWRRRGAYVGTVVGAGAYLAVMVVVGALMPAVNGVGSFPADTLWFFRLASLLTLVTLWGVLGVVLTGLVGRLHQQATAATARRELAASL